MFRIFLLIAFITVLITGCSSYRRYYLYDGNPLPVTQVAYVGVHSTLTVINIDTIPMKNTRLTGSLDILPGKHTIDFSFGASYRSNSMTTTSSGALSTLELNAQAGHIYYIYPSFPTRDTWQPKVIDIVKAEDLSTIPPYLWDSIDVPEGSKKGYILNIKEAFEQHFQERQNLSISGSEKKYWE